MSDVNQPVEVPASPPEGVALSPQSDVSAPPPVPPSAPEPPRKHHVAPALVSLDRVEIDERFRVRSEEEGDVAALATDIARLGQLFPVDLRLKAPDRFVVITGFRRVAALKFLQREKILARLHTDLSDDDATLLALAEGIHSQPVSREDLAAYRARLSAEGRLTPAGRDMLDKALADDDGLAPEEYKEGGGEEEEEVDADELAADVTMRLGEINQDLALLADVFKDLDDTRRSELIKQLKYSSELVEYLESLK
jgi:ParB-like chromosome segregation protein Spo0J